MKSGDISQIRSSVVGVGYLGRFHAQKHKSFGTLKVVCDHSPARAEEIGSELGVSFTSDYKSLVGKVDAVTIASDTTAHYEVAKFFLENKVHVLVEKPITVNVKEAEELITIAKKHSLVLQVGHVERFNPVFMAGQKLFKQPRFVEIQRLAPFKTRSLSVDVVLDLMIHDLDLVRSFTKSSIKAISASGARVFSEYNDWAQAQIDFTDGFRASLVVSRTDSVAVRKMVVVEESKVYSLDLGGSKIQISEKSEDVSQPLKLSQVEVEKSDALQLETRAFFESIAAGAPVKVTGEDGLEALRLVELVIGKIKG
jgi:predicted dehydrogenase